MITLTWIQGYCGIGLNIVGVWTLLISYRSRGFISKQALKAAVRPGIWRLEVIFEGSLYYRF